MFLPTHNRTHNTQVDLSNGGWRVYCDDCNRQRVWFLLAIIAAFSVTITPWIVLALIMEKL